jgi:hypothetical protein
MNPEDKSTDSEQVKAILNLQHFERDVKLEKSSV